MRKVWEGVLVREASDQPPEKTRREFVLLQDLRQEVRVPESPELAPSPALPGAAVLLRQVRQDFHAVLGPERSYAITRRRRAVSEMPEEVRDEEQPVRSF